jgi:hypothetical protein
MCEGNTNLSYIDFIRLVPIHAGHGCYALRVGKLESEIFLLFAGKRLLAAFGSVPHTVHRHSSPITSVYIKPSTQACLPLT